MSAPATSPSGLLAAGNWIVDTTKIVNVYPEQDTLANILSQERNNGGGAFNLTVDLARLGAPFPLAGLGLVGDDANGAWVRAECDRHGINADLIQTHPTAGTSYTDVMSVASTGRRTFFHQRGANAHLAPEHFPWDRIRTRLFYLGYLLLLDSLDAPDPEHGTRATRVLAAAGQHGLYRVVDIVSAAEADYSTIKPALRHTDLLICNEHEAQQVTGVTVRDSAGRLAPENLAVAARALIACGVRDWVVIHMPEGALACAEDGPIIRQPSVRLAPNQLKGANGAGDAFAAGLVFGRHQGTPMAESLRDGVCSAAACLQHSTTSGGLRPLAECRAFGDTCGYRPLEF